MNCKQCGTEVPDKAAFCPACGAPLAEAASPPAGGRDRLTDAAASVATPGDAEQQLWAGRYSKLAMLGAWISAGVLTVGLLAAAALLGFTTTAWLITLACLAVVWIVLLLRLLYQQLSIRYAMTNQRLVHERGILWRQIDRIEAIDIDDVTFTQGPVERLLGIGTIRIISSDQSTPEFRLVGIENVRDVANLIDDVRRKERRKRAVHIESI
jgi:membrane protein YdbS with pleckstrin-like domain